MAVDDRKTALVSGIEQAQEALAGLDKEQRRQQQAAFSRLGAGLSFARLTVEGTDTALLTDGLQAELASLLGEITNNPQQAAASPDGFHDRLMRLLAALPVSRGRDLEQEAKGAASSFRRSTSQHLRRIEVEVRELRDEIATAQSEMQSAVTGAREHVGEARTALDSRLTEIEAAATSAREQIEKQAESQQEAFEEEREQRSRATESQWDELRDQIKESADTLVADVERMRDEVRETVGAVGAATTANHYGDVAKRERKAYFRLGVVTFVALGIAAGFAIAAASRADPSFEQSLSKLSVSLVLGALAAFTGSRALDHRNTEKRANDIEVELRVFGPFTENLPEPQRTTERIVMTRRLFGRSSATSTKEDEEPAIEAPVSSEE